MQTHTVCPPVQMPRCTPMHLPTKFDAPSVQDSPTVQQLPPVMGCWLSSVTRSTSSMYYSRALVPSGRATPTQDRVHNGLLGIAAPAFIAWRSDHKHSGSLASFLFTHRAHTNFLTGAWYHQFEWVSAHMLAGVIEC